MNIRDRIEADLRVTLEGDWGLPVALISPSGEIISTSLNGGPLLGQVLYDTIKANPETGEVIIVGNPVVTLRRSSLSRVPVPGEKWVVRIPTSPSTTAPLEDFMIDSKPSEGGRSIGVIKLYLRRAKQQVQLQPEPEDDEL